VIVALFPDETRKLITSIFGVSNEAFVFIALIILLVLGIVISIAIVIINWHRKHKRSQRESMSMSLPSQKKANWLVAFKFRRPPIWKGKQRIEFWTTTIIIEIMSPISIYVFYILFSASPESAKTFSLTTTIVAIGAMISLMVLFTWLAIAELYAIREYRKQLVAERKATYLDFTKKFDRAFKAVQEESDPDLKKEMLGNFQEQLYTLCRNYEWNIVKDRIEKVLEDVIPEKLFDDPYAKKYLQFLAMIINRFGEHVIDIISKRWLKEIDKFYDNPDYDTASIPHVLYILLQLRGYSKDYLMKLIDDAATRWSKLKFQLFQGDLELAFGELEKRDESAHEEIISYLHRKMRDAKQNNEEEAYGRFNTLFKMANK